jgi:hypothetical protein
MEIMFLNNLVPTHYGFICYDEWDAEVIEYPAQESREATEDEEAVPYTPAQTIRVREAGSSYGFRTDELLMFIARGFEARLAALEALA